MRVLRDAQHEVRVLHVCEDALTAALLAALGALLLALHERSAR